MKKLLALLLALALIFALAACGGKKNEPAGDTAPQAQGEQVPVSAEQPLQPAAEAPQQQPAQTQQPSQTEPEPQQPEGPKAAEAIAVYAAQTKTEGRAEDEEQTLVYSITWERLSLETAEPEKLAQAVAELNGRTQEYAEENCGQTVARANERYAEQLAEREEPPEGQEPAPVALDFAAEYETRELYVTRADTRVLSAAERVTYRTRGLGTIVRYEASNIASETGEALSAGMVFKDLDALAQTLSERLGEYIAQKYPGQDFAEIDGEALAEVLKEDKAVWTLGSEGAAFYFLAQEKLLTARIFYDKDAELFEPYYREPAQERSEPIFTGELEADLDGDGEIDSLSIYRKTESGELVFLINGEEKTFGFEGKSFEAYYVVSGGERYIYVNALNGEEPGWTEIYRPAPGETAFIGTVEDSARDASRCRIAPGRSLMTDPQRFAMGREADLLGGFPVIRIYRVGEDGMPAPLDPAFNSDGETTLTLTQDFEVQSITGKSVTLRSQTKLMLLSTDGVWSVSVSDGQGIYTIYDTLAASGEYINGLAVKDVFAELAPPAEPEGEG